MLGAQRHAIDLAVVWHHCTMTRILTTCCPELQMAVHGLHELSTCLRSMWPVFSRVAVAVLIHWPRPCTVQALVVHVVRRRLAIDRDQWHTVMHVSSVVATRHWSVKPLLGRCT